MPFFMVASFGAMPRRSISELRTLLTRFSVIVRHSLVKMFSVVSENARAVLVWMGAVFQARAARSSRPAGRGQSPPRKDVEPPSPNVAVGAQIPRADRRDSAPLRRQENSPHQYTHAGTSSIASAQLMVLREINAHYLLLWAATN